ncbi:MAG: thiamine phosphate synthase [Chloroflexota bacterium]
MNSSRDSDVTPMAPSFDAASGRERVARAIIETGLCLITDDRLEIDELLESTRRAILGGVRLVQYRDKHSSRRQFLEKARHVQALCTEHKVAFIVNDLADVALILGADGLHLGQDDLPSDLARSIVGDRMAIGLSISYVPEAETAAAEQIVDYIGCGAVFPTSTKPDAEFGGLELLRAVREILQVPILGIGGITAENLAQPLAAGADGVALVSAVYGHAAPDEAARQILGSIRRARTQ